MTHIILSDMVTSISEFKKHPMHVLNNAHGEAVAVLSRNQPVFYCISPEMMEIFVDAMEDTKLIEIAKSRAGEKAVKVNLNMQ
jgi:antitoxin StbD